MKQFILWAIIKRLTESESILLIRGIEAQFRARLQPYLQTYNKSDEILTFTQMLLYMLSFYCYSDENVSLSLSLFHASRPIRYGKRSNTTVFGNPESE